MNIGIIAIGRLKRGLEGELFERYQTRAQNIGRQIGFSGFEVSEIVESRGGSKILRQKEEAKNINAQIAQNSIIIALDENGQNINSQKFASMLANFRDEGNKNLHFIIGGADGIDRDLRAKANKILAFSALTWPHQLVRIMLMEQIYRAMTILTNHPYHREG